MDRQDKHLMIEDYRAGIIASMIVNVNRSSTEAKLWKPVDFFPHKEWETKVQKFEEESDMVLFQQVKAINAALHGIDRTGDAELAASE